MTLLNGLIGQCTNVMGLDFVNGIFVVVSNRHEAVYLAFFPSSLSLISIP